MDIKEYLKEAKSAIIDLNDKQKELKAVKEKEESLNRSLNKLEKEQADCIEKTTKAKKNEILKHYESLYTQAGKVVKEKEEVKAKARSEKIKAIVEEGTASVKEECQKIKDELKQKMIDEKIPFFVNTKLFYALFMPTVFTDYLLMFFVLVICVVGIPFYIYRQNRFTDMIWLVVLIIAAIFIYGCVIILIDHLFVEKRRDAIKECAQIRKEYINAKKAISNKAEKVRREIKDDQLALDTYDYDIKKAREEQQRVIEEKNSTLKQFDEVMVEQTRQEVIQAAKKDFDEIEEKIVDIKNELKTTTDEYEKLQAEVKEKYESELGKDLMSERAISALIDRVNKSEEEVTSIEQAKALLKK
jgi:hypothetical protein